ncbi:hypothetical protein CDAR_43641 [Caerostris darwini]|uniref:Uncharacterized protein n=1 Tax=Caerostris darwini TaxID=1538125 RepID=A0AAV4WK62_9ARAC|nr:hypothetical protein CDAR_43641 [Caerostris darwini]
MKKIDIALFPIDTDLDSDGIQLSEPARGVDLFHHPFPHILKEQNGEGQDGLYEEVKQKRNRKINNKKNGGGKKNDGRQGPLGHCSRYQVVTETMSRKRVRRILIYFARQSVRDFVCDANSSWACRCL